ncbi:alanine racemase [Desulfopila sp. IMCC35008]|uniref:alanine racemase n=1 Tax=Desulfopila sp. IMCC35008 TaxID=2653858 RepID=UPI0013D566BC|nr:alanine racemase [Desulfopila sp. IMCC35008]
MKDLSDLQSYNRVLVDITALAYNYRLLSSLMPEGIELLAMVKGDGYGHGMIESAKAFAKAGCVTFGVAELREGVLLREAGIEGAIFVMVGFIPDQVSHYFTSCLTPVVFSSEAIELLAQTALERDTTIDIHLKVDCGMSRLGVQPSEVGRFARLIESLPGVHLAGVVSHFPESDNVKSESTNKAYRTFETACQAIGGQVHVLNHIANSGAVLNFPETICDMGRAGIALYGYPPSTDPEDAVVGNKRLRPVMSFTTRVVMVKTVAAGTGISYGHTFVTERETKLAVLPVGYEDGYPRCLSNRGEVLIKGKRASILGRVCMNLCMVDITEIDGVEVGDEAVLLGSQGQETITADDIAGWAGTISYELLCMLGNNNQRVYTE